MNPFDVLERARNCYLLEPRYRMHCWASGDDAMSYDEWRELLMIECNYRLWKALTNYARPVWKFWRWAIFRPRKIVRFLCFVYDMEIELRVAAIRR